MRPSSLGHIGPSAFSLYVSFPSLAFSMNNFMETRGFEPLTLGLQSRCSSQLSYVPRLPGDSRGKNAGRPASGTAAGARTLARLPLLSERR